MNKETIKLSPEILKACGIRPDHRLLVALSGGADSVALLRLLLDAGIDCKAAHCNFHLRGAESDRDEGFVRDLCSGLRVELFVKDFDVASRRALTGESVEMACRTLRYEWFEQLRVSLGLDAIAVAHHRDDNVETFLLNALRGSGVKGLKAMLPRNGVIVRPLLELTRKELEKYLADSGAGFVTDSTNAENIFTRNRIRNRLIPEANSLFAGASARLGDTVAILRDNYFMLEDYIKLLKEKYVSDKGEIAAGQIVSENPHPVQVIYELGRDGGIGREMAEKIVADPNAAGLTFGHYTLDRGTLRPLAENEFRCERVFPGQPPLIVRRGEAGTFRPVRDPMRAWFDTAVLEGNPHFEVRNWRKGDRFTPFGMRGSKKLSDLFSDMKLDENTKHSVRILTRDDEIIWIPGLRASALFPVKDKTKEFVEFQWIES